MYLIGLSLFKWLNNKSDVHVQLCKKSKDEYICSLYKAS